MKTLLLASIFLIEACPVHADKNITLWAGNVDWSCAKPKPPFPCAMPEPGIFLRYWEPVLVMETVKPSQGWQSMGGGNLQFHEVHLYDFPLKLAEDIVACPSLPNMTLGVHYLSEMDSSQWRSSKEKGLFADRVGVWGPLFPRSGFLVHPSSAVSSALDALRAVSIASDVIPRGHIVESPLDFQMNMSIDQMQMVYPAKTMCMEPGRDLRYWNPRVRESKDGEYVWIFWHYRECCKPVVPPP